MQPTQKAAQLISLAKLNNYYPCDDISGIENLDNTSINIKMYITCWTFVR